MQKNKVNKVINRLTKEKPKKKIMSVVMKYTYALWKQDLWTGKHKTIQRPYFYCLFYCQTGNFEMKQQTVAKGSKPNPSNVN